jgi:hypothetical protein
MNIHFVKSPIVLAVLTWRICVRDREKTSNNFDLLARLTFTL